MRARGFASVQVVAVHVECGRCGATARVEHTHPDAFTRQVLQPLGSWWEAHHEPRLVMLEVIADGVHQEWAAAS